MLELLTLSLLGGSRVREAAEWLQMPRLYLVPQRVLDKWREAAFMSSAYVCRVSSNVGCSPNARAAAAAAAGSDSAMLMSQVAHSLSANW